MRLLFAGLIALLPMQSLALSCMPWSVQSSYSKASDSADDYVVVHGTLQVAQSALPKVDWQRQDEVPPLTRAKGRISGKALSRSGFTVPFDETITVIVQCYGPWCQSVSPGEDYLGFLRKTGAGYELVFNPCATMGWVKPTPAMLEQVKSCLAGADCQAEQR